MTIQAGHWSITSIKTKNRFHHFAFILFRSPFFFSDIGSMSADSSHSKSFCLHSIFATWTESWSSFSLSGQLRRAEGWSAWLKSAPVECKQGEPWITINFMTTELEALDTHKTKKISSKLQQQRIQHTCSAANSPVLMWLWWTVDGLLKPPSDNSSFLRCLISLTQHKHIGEQKTITNVFFPPGPSRRCSTSHSRQRPGTPPAGHSQSISSLFGPACTFTLSVVGGFTGNTIVKTMSGWEDLGDETFFPPSNTGMGACVPWFWICREMNCARRGPSGDEPFTQRLMSVKRGSEVPANLQPLLTPLETM